MPEQSKIQCSVSWNPGTWPYATRCSLQHGHGGAVHKDRHGRTIPDLGAVQEPEKD